MKTMDDKKRVLTKKTSLKDSRRYQNVYIYSDQTREERLLSANFRSLVSAYKSGDNNIRVRGTRIISEKARSGDDNIEEGPSRSYRHPRRQERDDTSSRQSSRSGLESNRGHNRGGNRDRTESGRHERSNRSHDYEGRRYGSGERDNHLRQNRNGERHYAGDRRSYRDY